MDSASDYSKQAKAFLNGVIYFFDKNSVSNEKRAEVLHLLSSAFEMQKSGNTNVNAFPQSVSLPLDKVIQKYSEPYAPSDFIFPKSYSFTSDLGTRTRYTPEFLKQILPQFVPDHAQLSGSAAESRLFKALDQTQKELESYGMRLFDPDSSKEQLLDFSNRAKLNPYMVKIKLKPVAQGKYQDFISGIRQGGVGGAGIGLLGGLGYTALRKGKKRDFIRNALLGTLLGGGVGLANKIYQHQTAK